MERTTLPLDAAFDAAQAQEEQPSWEDEPEVPQDVQTLLFNGYLTQSVQIGTHEVVLRTLKIGEEFDVALVSDKYKETFESVRALATATIAAAIQSVDGRGLVPMPFGPSDLTLDAKYAYVLDQFYAPVIDKLYAEYRELRKRMYAAFDALGKV
jgi:hypothetical protein